MENSTKKKLIDFLEGEEEVKLAYLFGSVATGKNGKLSDIDIAVYFDESLSKKEMFDLQLKLISKITTILKTDKVDLVVTNNVPLLLKYSIIKYGEVLKSEKEKKVAVETKILSDYLDMKYYIDRHTKIAIKRISKMGLV